MMFKNDTDKWQVINALQVAAQTYEADAEDHPTLAAEFKQQAKDCRRIAEQIEEDS